MKTNEILAHLTFRLDTELFAINVSKVISILEMSYITKIPNAPVYLKGVINLRGKVLPVIDGRIKMGMPTKEADRESAIIVLSILVDTAVVSVGLQVDAVHSVLEIDPAHVLPAPSIGDKFKTDFITGIYNLAESNADKTSKSDDLYTSATQYSTVKSDTEDHLVMILDIDKIFSTNEIISLKSHTEAVPE